MSITTYTPGNQAFTLLCTNAETKQTNICMYNSSAILTTDQDAIMQYARQLVLLFPANIYTVAFVESAVAMNEHVKIPDYATEQKIHNNTVGIPDYD